MIELVYHIAASYRFYFTSYRALNQLIYVPLLIVLLLLCSVAHSLIGTEAMEPGTAVIIVRQAGGSLRGLAPGIYRF